MQNDLISLPCSRCWIAVRSHCKRIRSPWIASYPTKNIYVKIFSYNKHGKIPGTGKEDIFVNSPKKFCCPFCHLTIRQRIHHLDKKDFFGKYFIVHLGGWSHNPEQQFPRLSRHLGKQHIDVFACGILFVNFHDISRYLSKSRYVINPVFRQTLTFTLFPEEF